MEIEKILMWVVSGCTFIVTIVMPWLSRVISGRVASKIMQKYKDQTENVETLRQSIKQLERAIEELKKKNG